jgi:hypothetical protein
MGMTRTAPWWLTWLLMAGLVSIFLGERVMASLGMARTVLTGLGAAILLICLVWRLLSWRAAEGEIRKVEGMLVLAYAGCAIALFGYFLTTDTGLRWFGIDFADFATRIRYLTALRVLWPILLVVSALPALGAQLALGAHRHARGGAPGVESFRVRETATGGLTVALAGSLLFVIGYIASARDQSLDLSYFKTSVPGTATEGMLSAFGDPLRVLLFFPPVNEVRDEVERYFRRLDDGSGRVRIEVYDRMVSPRVAEENFVTEDGTIVLVRGDQRERLVIGTDMNRARANLRTLDREVQSALLPLIRGRRVVYLTTGHGELNDPQTAGPFGAPELGGVEVLNQILAYLNYDVRDLGVTTGLAADVPADASIVLSLGPRRPFLDSEVAAIERYLDRGGAILFALDPESDFRLGVLEERLGIRYVHTPLADDEQHVVQRGDLSDRRLIVTDRFDSHDVTTTVNRAGIGAGILLVRPGYIEPLEGSEVNPYFLARSLPSTFIDHDRDHRFDEANEARGTYALIAAVQGPPVDAQYMSVSHDDATTPEAMRALVFPSSAMFADAVLSSLGLNAGLVADAVKWLGGEEAFVGTTESEEDVPIVHTRAQDVGWFYATILGAPTLILGLGLLGVFRYRRRRGER